MGVPPRLWIVIADGAHARFVLAGPSGHWRTVRCFDSVTALARTAELGSERPGRVFESASATRHAIAPRHDLKLTEKERFARLIGAELNAARARGEVDDIFIVALVETQTRIHEVLNEKTAEIVIGTLAKNLVKIPDHELATHLTRLRLPAANGRLILPFKRRVRREKKERRETWSESP